MSFYSEYKKKRFSEGGDVKGVHAPMRGGQSEAGHYVRDAANIKDKHGNEMTENAKGEHKRVLGEMKSMRKPNLYANGGEVANPSPCDDHGVSGCRDCTPEEMDTPDKPMPVTGGYAEGGMIDRIMAKRFPKEESEEMDTEDSEMAHEPDGPSVSDPEPEDDDDDMIGRIMKKRLAGR